MPRMEHIDQPLDHFRAESILLHTKSYTKVKTRSSAFAFRKQRSDVGGGGTKNVLYIQPQVVPRVHDLPPPQATPISVPSLEDKSLIFEDDAFRRRVINQSINRSIDFLPSTSMIVAPLSEGSSSHRLLLPADHRTRRDALQRSQDETRPSPRNMTRSTPDPTCRHR